MKKVMRFISKNWLLLLLVLVIVIYFSYNYVNEGFQNRTSTICTQQTCRGSNSWINNRCYRSCATLGGGTNHRTDNTKCIIKARPGENDRVVNRPVITTC